MYNIWLYFEVWCSLKSFSFWDSFFLMGLHPHSRRSSSRSTRPQNTTRCCTSILDPPSLLWFPCSSLEALLRLLLSAQPIQLSSWTHPCSVEQPSVA